MSTTSPHVSRKKLKSSKKSALAGKSPTGTISPIVSYVLIGLVILSFAMIRLRLRDMPLERDEGEYAYAGQLILQGVPPYQLAYSMKLPGTFVSYALILAVFGQTPAGVHDGLLLVNAATTLLVFLLGTRLFGRLAGLVAGASYALLSTSSTVLGFAGHATHFVALPAVGGTLLLLHATESKHPWQFFCSGALAGLAFVMKQPGILFIFFSALYILKSELHAPIDYLGLTKRLGSFLLGAALPFALICLWMLRAGVFHKFWFWTFAYASQYGTIKSLPDGARSLWAELPEVLGPTAFLWILALVGLTALWWSSSRRSEAALVNWFALFSFVAVCPGFFFRSHYFILMLPAVALLDGLAVSAARDRFGGRRFWRAVPILVFLAACTYSLAEEGDFLFNLDPIAACRETYGKNPFPEAVKIGDYIRSHTTEGTKIAVLGSEPEIYFYARRHSGTGYIYTYPLMEPQAYAPTMQKEMSSEIEASRPEFLVLVNVSLSWLRRPNSNTAIFDWWGKYVVSHYERVGIADIGAHATEYRWDDEAKTYHPSSPSTVSVFRRSVP